MIFCKDVLFIHVPKTGGISLTKYLLEVLPRPVYYAYPIVEHKPVDNGIVQIPGVRHETLEEAKEVLREYGFDLFKIPLILAVMRNPYSLEVSRYAYLQKGHSVDKGHNQQLALTRSFETFAIESNDHGGPLRPLESYFSLEGKIPRNLSIIKFENLAEGVREALRRVGIEKTVDLPQINPSRHDHFLSYYTKDAEEAVYRKYKWVFDNGFYERLEPRNLTLAKEPAWCDHRVPIVVGPARQIGPSHGLWTDDLWVGDTLTFEIKAGRPISKVTVEGELPHKFDTETEFVLTINGEQTAASFESGGPFALHVPCSIAPGTPTKIELTTSTTWCPREVGVSEDERQLSFVLNRIIFESPQHPYSIKHFRTWRVFNLYRRLRNKLASLEKPETASVEPTKSVSSSEPGRQKALDALDKTPPRALDASHQDVTLSRTNRRYLEPIFIVGQYKCGSTWLLQALGAHPQVIGVAEVDIVQAACQLPKRKNGRAEDSTVRLTPVEDRLHKFFGASGWCAHYDGTRWLGRDASAQLERGENMQAIFGDYAKKRDRSKLQKFMNLPSEVSATLYRDIKEAERPEDAMDAFLEAVCADAQGESHVVLKGADQIAVFEALKAWQPEAKKIVITRDGRDAAISDSHFRKLMHKRNAPFAGNLDMNYWELLKAWAHRADMVAEKAREGELRVIRYEDLTRDFGGTLKPLLTWLQLDASDSVIEAINEQTSFEATTGRSRGTEAEHVFRKGAVGEWIDALSKEDKAKAWSLAGEQLSAFGYTQDGRFMPLPEAQQSQSLTERIREVVRSALRPRRR